jgi:hypothetical protein
MCGYPVLNHRQPDTENSMENLTHKLYSANPNIREELEEEARRLRREAFHDFIVQPVVRLWSRLTNSKPVYDHRTVESA